MIDLISIFVAGVFSCIILDILGYLLKLAGIPEPSWSIVGRWTYYMLRNLTFYNPGIAEMPKFKNELLLGWFFHYYISICWAIIYYFFFIFLGNEMNYYTGLIFGALTTLAPLIIVDDGAGGTNRKAALSRIVTLVDANSSAASAGFAVAMAIAL